MKDKQNKPPDKEPIELNLAVICLIIYLVVGNLPSTIRDWATARLVFLLEFLFLLLALFFAVLALRKIIRTRNNLPLIVIPGVIMMTTMVLLAVWIYTLSTTPFTPAYRLVCGPNMKGLGMAILVYADDNDGKYPTPDKWCDLVIQAGKIPKENFRCPANRKARSTYAMNPN